MNTVDTHPPDQAKTPKRRTWCKKCGAETWFEWKPGHRWTCPKGHVRQENVWVSAQKTEEAM